MDAAASGPALRGAGLVKRYGERPALRGVDLEVRAGAAFALVGANGAGKTTLIKCVLDLSAPQAGRIELFGVDHRRAEARARLCYLPERFAPPHFLRGREFLAMTAALSGQPYDHARAAALAGELELDPEALERPARELSTGMAQKLGLAASFLAARDLVVLDEPMSGLDPASRVAVKAVLARLRREGRTLFLTTHVLSDVEELCEDMAVLDQGRLRFHGAPAALCARHGEPALERAFLRCLREAGGATTGETSGDGGRNAARA